MGVIISFDGDYRFLSNFYTSKVIYKDIEFNSVECAYQAAKVKNASDLVSFVNLSPFEAKQWGKKVELRDDWENIKVGIMMFLLRQKFQDPTILGKLLKTDGLYLVEGNYWHDNQWGVCYCKKCSGMGKNLLGTLLMSVRNENLII